MGALIAFVVVVIAAIYFGEIFKEQGKFLVEDLSRIRGWSPYFFFGCISYYKKLKGGWIVRHRIVFYSIYYPDIHIKLDDEEWI